MVTLVCVVVGAAGAAFTVDVDVNSAVSDLKRSVRASRPAIVQCSAELLTLYVAKRDDESGGSDGAWLRADNADARALKRGSVTDRIKHLVQREAPMAASSTLSAHPCFGSDFAPARGDIHILVELPRDSEDVAYCKRRLKQITALYYLAAVVIGVSAGITISLSGFSDLVMLWLIFVTAVMVVEHFEREFAHGRAELAEAYRHMGYESIP